MHDMGKKRDEQKSESPKYIYRKPFRGLVAKIIDGFKGRAKISPAMIHNNEYVLFAMRRSYGHVGFVDSDQVTSVLEHTIRS